MTDSAIAEGEPRVCPDVAVDTKGFVCCVAFGDPRCVENPELRMALP